MQARRFVVLLAGAVGVLVFWAAALAWAGDADGDGVDDVTDVCNNTPAGAAVDAVGRPWGDIDLDCDTDLADYTLFRLSFTSLDEFASFQRGYTGSLPSPTLPGMVLIPAGEFAMGDTFNEGWVDEFPVHTVYVSAFYINKYEVTNQQYAAGLNWALGRELITVTGNIVYQTGGGGQFYCYTATSSSYSQITWNGSTFGVMAGKGNHPMVMVSWHGAAAYANWRSGMEGRQVCYDTSTWECNFNANGYRLPTEAEWEKAARGGTPGHRFPWSDTDTIQHSRANYSSSSDDLYDTSPTRGYHPAFSSGEFPYTSPVGYFAPNGYGLYDMVGNVCEWCNDWYNSSYYSHSPSSNPTGGGSDIWRVLRGGGWRSPAWWCRSAIRSHEWPDYGGYYLGFRCVAGT